MAEYVAGRGTTALGIIGTVLGGLGVMGNNGSSLLNLGNGGTYETHNATMHDIEDAKVLAEKDAEIQALKMAQQTDAKIIDTYKELQGQINTMKEEAAKRWTEQMVVNSQLTSATNVNSSNLIALQNNFNTLTKIVIPSSNVCNTGCGCSGNM